MSPTDDQPPKMLPLSRLIQAVASARSEQEVNGAMLELHAAAWPMLRPIIARGMNERRVCGHGASLDEPADIYNLVLQRVANGAKYLRGPSEAEAEAWLKKITKRLIEDSVKTARRRRERWRRLEWMARLMYPHKFDRPQSHQEQDDDGE